MKRKMALLLAVMMVLTILPGCSENEIYTPTDPVDSTPAESGQASSEPSKSSAPQQDQPDGEQPNGQPKDELYPLSDTAVRFELWYSFPGDLADVMEDALTNNSVLKAAEEKTNISLSFILQSVQMASENFNLIVVSQDYPDFMYNPGSYYAGGMDKAIEDEVFLDLTDLAAEYAPNYYELISADENVMNGVTTASGKIADIKRLMAEPAKASTGLVIRKDWLDELGMDIPVTYDDFHEVLTAFKTEKGVIEPYGLWSSGVAAGNQFVSGYDVNGMMAAFMGSYPIFQVSGEVKFGWIEDGFKNYLEMMSQWCEEGLISGDFFAENVGWGIDSSKTTTGQVGLWTHDYFQINLVTSQMQDPNAEVVAVADAVLREGQTLHFGTSESIVGGNSWGITTDCENIEIALRYIDYFFTTEGSEICNYGVEGEGMKRDAAGNPQYTELVYNNPDGMSMRQTQLYYTLTIGPFIEVESRSDIAYGKNEVASRDIWDSNSDDAYLLPSYLSLTAEQAEEFNSLIGDISTYASGKIIEFIIGSDTLDNWDDYLSMMDQLGIRRVIEIYQEALDS